MDDKVSLRQTLTGVSFSSGVSSFLDDETLPSISDHLKRHNLFQYMQGSVISCTFFPIWLGNTHILLKVADAINICFFGLLTNFTVEKIATKRRPINNSFRLL